jgi:hypothetical protein
MTKREDKVEIELEVSEETAAWLREEAAKTGKTIDEIINGAILKYLIFSGNERVLVSKNMVGSRSIFCIPGIRIFDRFSLTSEIVAHNNAAEIHIYFAEGKILDIFPETTWDEVDAYLDTIF